MDPGFDMAAWNPYGSGAVLNDSEEARLMQLRMARKGKWTEEEETYTMKLIEAFIAGVLPLPQGTTLRSFLSDKLCWYKLRFLCSKLISTVTP